MTHLEAGKPDGGSGTLRDSTTRYAVIFSPPPETPNNPKPTFWSHSFVYSVHLTQGLTMGHIQQTDTEYE